MGTNQFNPTLPQAAPQCVAVSSLVVNEPSRILARPTWTRSRDGYLLERRLDERDFRWRRWGNANSQRYTPAVCHHHELCTLSAFGFADGGEPFSAGENVPSLNVSSHDRMPSSSSSPRNLRQRSSQKAASSHSCSRRQHVARDGYCSRRSFHRALLRSTHNMPLKQRRASTRSRPPYSKASAAD